MLVVLELLCRQRTERIIGAQARNTPDAKGGKSIRPDGPNRVTGTCIMSAPFMTLSPRAYYPRTKKRLYFRPYLIGKPTTLIIHLKQLAARLSYTHLVFEFRRRVVRRLGKKVEVHGDKSTTVHIGFNFGIDDEQPAERIAIIPGLSH